MSAFNSLLNPLVRRYLRWKQGDEEDQWSNKAQEALIKKLKREGQFENLQAALSMKKEHGPCVKIGRSQDGRLQVSHKKMLPHVMYCRVFRWPDLQSQHELRSVSTCHWPAHKRELTMVCINPYHYVRVDHSIFPAVVAVRNDSQQQQQQQPQQHDASPPSAGGSYPSQQSSPYVTPPPQNTGYLQPTAIASNTWYGAPFPAYGDPAPMEIAYDIKPMNSWCRISYYELNQRVGDAFKSDARTVTIDGGTDPEATTSGRFCLGALSNPSRRKAISDIRSLIGPGITLEQDNGQIHVKNLSDHPVFFNSRIHNMENQLHPHTVVRVSPGVRMKMFDHNIFAGLLDQTYNSQDIKKYEQIYSLIDYCIIKLGFVKGWGAMYHRQDATSTPCWTEIQLLKELGMIEQCLKQIGRPTASQVTSTS